MVCTVDELARHCGARRRGGDGARLVAGAANLEEAGPDQVAPLTDLRYLPFLARARAAAVVVKSAAEQVAAPAGVALLEADDPEMAFLQLVLLLHPPAEEEPDGVDPLACVEAGARLDERVSVGPFAVIRRGARIEAGCRIMAGVYIGRDCHLGPNCRLYPRVVLYDGVRLGSDCILHSGAVLGADGFGYKFRAGRHVKVPQVGGVLLGDQVEVGANTCVDRAALGQTRLGAGTKVDNLVQVGHNAQVGRHVILCGQVGVAGSSVVQDYVLFGAAAGCGDHITIGQGARIGGMSGIAQNIPPGTEVFGYPAVEAKLALRQFAALRRLPALFERLRELEQKVRDLEEGGRRGRTDGTGD